MSNDKTSATGNGIGCGSVLFFIFLTLKLTGHIAWSWWWVTAPLWAPIALAIIIMLIAGTVAVFKK